MQKNRGQFLRGFVCGSTVGLFLVATLQLSYKAEPASGTSSAGRRLFEKNQCSTCHSIESRGGCLAPPLDDIGKRKGKAYILARITNSNAARTKFATYKIQELMPHPRVAPAAASELAEYLSMLRSDFKSLKIGEHPVNSKAAATDSSHANEAKSQEAGKVLFYTKGCMECHSVFGGGGQFAPALDGISQRQDRKHVLSRINNAELLQLGVGGEYQERGTNMPPSDLTQAEIESIADFLMTIPPRK